MKTTKVVKKLEKIHLKVDKFEIDKDKLISKESLENEDSKKEFKKKFGGDSLLRQIDLKKEYKIRQKNPLNYDSDSSMSDNEEHEIET